MKKILVITFITGLSLAAMFYLTRLHCFIDGACPAASQQVGQPSGKPYAPPKEKVRGIYAAMEYLHQIRANSQTGELDLADVYRARQQMMEQRIRQQSMKSSAALQLEWEELGPDNVGGRTRAILVDRNNPSRVYAGGVSGGLFCSDNGGLSWKLHPDNVNFGHLGISCMAQASNGDIYFGTGEYFAYGDGHTNSMAFIGEGIYKSTDGGQTFQHLPSTTPSVSNSRSAEWAFVNELAIHPMDDNYVYAATNRGLRISNDAGATWNVIPNLDVGTNNNCSEVVVGGNGVIYASINNQYYRSEDFGLNFTRMMG
ncbi:MAG: exo-alpha-sialidase, partial [Chloroflexi bacterium]